jgi:hypothetical protein
MDTAKLIANLATNIVPISAAVYPIAARISDDGIFSP